MCPGTSLAEHCFVASQWRCCPWEESLRVQGKLVDSFQHGLWVGKEGNVMQYDGKVSEQLTTLFVCFYKFYLVWSSHEIEKILTSAIPGHGSISKMDVKILAVVGITPVMVSVAQNINTESLSLRHYFCRFYQDLHLG